MKLAKNYRASIGVFAGLQSQGISYGQINIPNKNMDPALNKEEVSAFVYPEISPGGFIYNRNFYAGLSMLQLYPAKRGKIGTKENRLTGHYFLTSGYRFRGRNLHYIPSFLFNFSPFISPTLDLTLTVEYEKIISLALGSKYLNSGYATIQLRVLPSVYLGYAYEYALNEINKVSPTTHEIVLRLGSCNSEGKEPKFICPAYE
jgi:type IX secretion system PorP/SprF family membrane protein